MVEPQPLRAGVRQVLTPDGDGVFMDKHSKLNALEREGVAEAMILPFPH